MADVLGAIRRKYLSFIPKDKSRVDPETGEVFSNLDAERSEQLDGTPVAPPIGYQKQPSMHEIMRQFIASERLRQDAEANGFDTPEEADDFDVGDDDEIRRTTQYELDADPEYLAARADLIDRHNNPDKYKEEDTTDDNGGEGVKTPSGAKPAKKTKSSPPEPLEDGSTTEG